jgi:hypothetical protein
LGTESLRIKVADEVNPGLRVGDEMQCPSSHSDLEIFSSFVLFMLLKYWMMLTLVGEENLVY